MSKKILIVDDSASIRQMVEATLKSKGYDVATATDGQAALDSCKMRQFDFVLTDQNMPRMDGLTLIKSLRQLPQYSRTPIIVLTTEAGDDMKIRAEPREQPAGWSNPSIPPNCSKLPPKCSVD